LHFLGKKEVFPLTSKGIKLNKIESQDANETKEQKGLQAVKKN
jgi:hypothetical protein